MSGRNLKVNLIANTSRFKSAMSETSNQMKLINSEFKNAAAETDKYGNKLDQTGAKKKQLNGVIEQYKSRIQAIKTEQQHWTRELEKGNITEAEHSQKQQELARRLNNTEGEMKRYEGQLKKINAEGEKTTKTYADFDRQFRDIGRTMRDVSAQVGITAGVGFVGMKRVMGGVIDEAKEFHAQMSEVQAISGSTADEMKLLTNQSKELGRATKFTAQEASQSQANLARAGFKVNEIYDAMPGLLDLAASSNLDLGTSANITSNIIRTFNYDASKAGKVADVLAKGAATANTDVQGLGMAMEVAGPVANSLDIALEQVAASAGIMADAGIDGSKSGRMLRQGMLRLAKPVGDAEKLLKKMSVNAFDADGNMKSLDKVVGELEKGLKGQTKQQKAAALATIFGSESTAGWTVLLDKGSEELKKYTKELESSEGAAKDMSEVMQDNAEGAIVRMQSALSGLKIELGEKLLPILSKGADFIGDLATKMSEWDEETVETIAETALLVTAVLGVTTAVAGLVAGFGALMAVAGPIGLAIVGGTTLLSGFAAMLWRSSKRTKKLAEEQAQAKEDAIRYGEGLSEGTRNAVKGYTDLYEGAKVKMMQLKSMTGDEAKETVEEVRKAFGKMADTVVAELETQKDKLLHAMHDVMGIAGEVAEEKSEEMSTEIISRFDEEIAQYRNAQKTIDKAMKEYGGEIAKMPKKLKEEYLEALKVMDNGSQAFAKNQEELQNIQKAISDRGGTIMASEVEGYIKRVDKLYSKSTDSANDYYNEMNEVFEQGLAQGKISQDEYELLISGVEVRTNEMLAQATTERAIALKELKDNMDARGELLDLATMEEFKRQEVIEEIGEGHQKTVIQRMQTDEEYLQSWLDHNEEVIKNSAYWSDRAIKHHNETLIKYLMQFDMTRDEAIKTAESMSDETLRELESRIKDAEKAGESKGKSFSEGLRKSKPKVKDMSKLIKDTSLGELKLGNSEANKSGELKATSFSSGMKGKRQHVWQVANSVSLRAKSGLESVKTTDVGANFSVGFQTGMNSKKKSIWNTAWSIGKNALGALKSSIRTASPSKETEQAGNWFSEGFGLGIKAEEQSAVEQAMSLAKNSLGAFDKEMESYKQSFGAIALAVEDNKQTLKVEHTLGSKFEELFSLFIANKNDNDNSIKELLNATQQQNQILLQLLQKDITAVLAFEPSYNAFKQRLNEDEYSRNKQKRRR